MSKLSDEEIKQAVDRFLAWKLPEDFSPDAGITYKKPDMPWRGPTGTNLLTALQAEAMIRHILNAPKELEENSGE